MAYALGLLAVAVLVFLAVPLALGVLTGRRRSVPPWALGLALGALLALVAVGTRSIPVVVVALLLGLWSVRPWRGAAGRPQRISTAPHDDLRDHRRGGPTVSS